MLTMNLTEEKNLAGLALIDTGFDRYLFVAMYWVWKSSITIETAHQCMKSIQRTANEKNHQDIINIVNIYR